MQVDEKQKTILLTEQGYADAEEILDVKDLYDPREQWASYVLNAMKAKELFLRDVNYIIRGKEVLIVDEFTGRVMQVILFSCLCTLVEKKLLFCITQFRTIVECTCSLLKLLLVQRIRELWIYPLLAPL